MVYVRGNAAITQVALDPAAQTRVAAGFTILGNQPAGAAQGAHRQVQAWLIQPCVRQAATTWLQGIRIWVKGVIQQPVNIAEPHCFDLYALVRGNDRLITT